ncbi:33509_t:CDS:2, partial [Gigaspora margarita]
EEAVVGAGLEIRGGVLRRMSTKGELGKEFLWGGKLITVVSSLYGGKGNGSSRSSGSNRVVIDQCVIKEEMLSRRRIGDTAKLLRLGIGRRGVMKDEVASVLDPGIGEISGSSKAGEAFQGVAHGLFLKAQDE